MLQRKKPTVYNKEKHLRFGRQFGREEQFPNHHQCPFDRGDVEQEGIGSTNLKQQNKV